MGFAAFQEIWKRSDVCLVLLLRKSKKNIKKFALFCREVGIKVAEKDKISQNGKLKIVWGDASNFDDISLAVKGIDWVLNCMAVIPPQADLHPEQAEKVNVKAVEYLIQAIKNEPNGADRIKFINIGSIAQYGDRMGTIHCGRVGDPMVINPFDFYGVTKYRAERLVINSGLKHWVQIRQTFILIPDLFSLKDPIMFHQPLSCFMECVTVRDAGFGLANVLNISDDSDFWRNVYNMGGGEKVRIVYLSFLKTMFGMMGMRLEKILEPKWFALRNFHMMYYEDTERLNRYLHHQRDTLDDYLKWVWERLPFYLKWVAKLNPIVPPLRWIVEKVTRNQLKNMALEKSGTLSWIRHKNDLRVKAFLGSYAEQQAISEWSSVDDELFTKVVRLNHGYDETKEHLDILDLQQAAQFRGWNLLTTEWNGDLFQPVEFQCALGHRFTSTPFSILKAGHGCPECDPPDWNYDEIARTNPFIAQVWHNTHGKDECNFYPKNCYKDICKFKV